MTSAVAKANPAQVVGVPMMTAEQAEECLARIGESAVSLRDALLDLDEREGWKALGYTSWRACVKDRFGDKSESYLYRLLQAAKIQREISPIGETARPLPTSQARVLGELPDADTRRKVYAEATAETNGKPTAAAIQSVADRVAPKPQRRNSGGSSDAELGFGDVPEDDAALGFDPTVADEIPQDSESQEAFAKKPSGSLCNDCRERFTGPSCPTCTAPDQAPAEGTRDTVELPPREIARPSADSPRASRIPPYVHPRPCTECGGDVVIESVQDERAREKGIADQIARGVPVVSLCERCQLGDAYPPQPTGFEDAPAETATDAAANETAKQEAPPESRMGASVGYGFGRSEGGQRSAISTPSPAPRKGPNGEALLAIANDAGDLTRALLDKPIPAVAEAILENASSSQLAGLVGILSTKLAPAQKAALDHLTTPAPTAGPVTLKAVKALILDHLSTGDVRDLEWWLSDARKQIGARERAGVAAAS
jgi:hypothetical protein